MFSQVHRAESFLRSWYQLSWSRNSPHFIARCSTTVFTRVRHWILLWAV